MTTGTAGPLAGSCDVRLPFCIFQLSFEYLAEVDAKVSYFVKETLPRDESVCGIHCIRVRLCFGRNHANSPFFDGTLAFFKPFRTSTHASTTYNVPVAKSRQLIS